MIGRPGSTLWLLGCELRLTWRALRTRGSRNAIGVTLLLLILAAGVGLPMGLALRRTPVSVTPAGVLIADAALLVVFSLMLSQTLAAATDALYVRGDLDLLFSSPLAPRKVLTIRFAAIAASAFIAFASLAAPILLPVAVLGHPAWLAALLVLAALALIASAAGLLISMALFRVIGPRRTRTVAQVTAALVGAGAFLAFQARNFSPDHGAGLLRRIAAAAQSGAFQRTGPLALPLRAGLGEPGPLALVVAGAVLMFAATSQWLGTQFSRDAAAAAGAEAGIGRVRTSPIKNFARGPFSAVVRKELRLLGRDAALTSQVLLRVLYLVPVLYLVLKNAAGHSALALAGGAGGLSFVSGQLAGSLAWITISAEDAPDLLACAPVDRRSLDRAKLLAALIPLAVVLVVPLTALIVLSPLAGLAAALGCAASAIACGLVALWTQRPAKRSEFRRRSQGSWLAVYGELIVSALIAGATGLTAGLSVWAIVPAVAAGVLLAAIRALSPKP